MPDYEYDQKLRELEELEAEHPEYITPDSPTQRVGGEALKAFAPVTHQVPLQSLQDVFAPEELTAFDARIRETAPETEYIVEPKVDGLSVALEYVDGRFVRGATRGDGQTGEDVTENLRTVRSIPMKLDNAPHRLIVRGECYMSRKTFQRLNEERAAKEEPLLANPRNAAAGSLRQLDPKIAAQRRLDCVIFNIQLTDGEPFQTDAQQLDYLEKLRFLVIPRAVLSDPAQVQAEIDRLGRERYDFPYEMDGAVVKVNDLSQRDLFGSTAKFPRWAVAWKYPPEQKPAKVLDIVVQVGRTGVLTPKAITEPVQLAGTTVTNATLHNQDFITEKDVRIGDTVLLQKAGEIIPQVVSVDVSKRPPDAVPYHLPEVCPVCGSPVVRDEDGVALRCTGAECPAQLVRNLVHFASRDCMDIEGLGPAVVRALVENDLIRTPGDLYHLNAQDVAKLDRMGEKSAENLIAAIEAAGSVPPHQRLRHPSGGYPWRPGAGGAVPHSGCAHGSGRGDADRGARRGSCHRPLFGGVVPKSTVPALGGDASGGRREYGVQAGAAGRSFRWHDLRAHRHLDPIHPQRGEKTNRRPGRKSLRQRFQKDHLCGGWGSGRQQTDQSGEPGCPSAQRGGFFTADEGLKKGKYFKKWRGNREKPAVEKIHGQKNG